MAVRSAYDKGRDALSGMLGGTTETTQSDNAEKLAANDPLLLDNAPDSIGPEVFVANGQLWESTGNFERALENYSKALAREPENAPALASIARLKYRQDQFSQATEYFERAIAANPAEAGLYNDLGLTQSKLGKHDEAITSIGQALAIAPGTSRYANNLATVMFAAGREEEARKTLLSNNKPAVAHYNMAYLHYNANQTDKALEELAQVLAMGTEPNMDASSQRAVTKSKELFDQLGGPASQIAQSLPQIFQGVKASAASASQLQKDASEIAATVQDTATGVSVQLTGGAEAAPAEKAAPAEAIAAPTSVAPPTDAVAEASQEGRSSNAAGDSPQSNAPAAASPADTAATPAQPPASGGMFSLPPEFLPADNSPETQTATQPTEAPRKR